MYIVRNIYRNSPEYLCLQQAVQAHYFKHYGATPKPSPDFFICLTEVNGRAPGIACVGITFGDSGKLFSEYYLKDSLDLTYQIERARIVEIGAFASFQKGSGAGKYLLNTVLKTLALQNYGLVVLTAIEQVRSILKNIVERIEDMGPAEQKYVQDPSVNWGTYYSHSPRIVVSHLTPPLPYISNLHWGKDSHSLVQHVSA
ncbi:thermostable hemolysin [Xenorhabdus bovienii]|uniref:Thermostable hemolysin n=1 Tax=Xenorhabdus bovienii str. kraussei Becker Underwood TaxID=1398204 RepID=A0A077PJE4_XENBV|nr:thermostable hemolysin [Xenorhabdus bovienii]CDH24555.1 conserved hypothetical protein [Xenorhabdus bovienii str. kraussei Becker Underwood]